MLMLEETLKNQCSNNLHIISSFLQGSRSKLQSQSENKSKLKEAFNEKEISFFIDGCGACC